MLEHDRLKNLNLLQHKQWKLTKDNCHSTLIRRLSIENMNGWAQHKLQKMKFKLGLTNKNHLLVPGNFKPKHLPFQLSPISPSGHP